MRDTFIQLYRSVFGNFKAVENIDSGGGVRL